MEQYRDEIRSVMISVNVIDGVYANCAKKMGIKENTLSLLYALDDGKPHSQKEICEQWMIPKSTINTIVKECIAAGYIVLADSSRTKEKEIYITEEGGKYAKKVLSRLYEMESRAMEKTLAAYSPEFIQAVEQYTACLKEETEHLHMERE